MITSKAFTLMELTLDHVSIIVIDLAMNPRTYMIMVMVTVAPPTSTMATTAMRLHTTKVAGSLMTTAMMTSSVPATPLMATTMTATTVVATTVTAISVMATTTMVHSIEKVQSEALVCPSTKATTCISPPKNATNAAAVLKIHATNRKAANADAVRSPRRALGGETTHPVSCALKQDNLHFSHNH